MIKKNEELTVIKSKRLIEARYGWNINEQRIFLLLASSVEKLKGPGENIWTCRVSELEKIFNSEKLTPQYLKNLCSNIMNKNFEMEDDNGNWKISKVLQGAEYYNGELKLVITDFIKPHLIELEKYYTQYQLKDVIQFKSQYSIRLFELIKNESWKREKYFTISVEELRKKFGIADDEYTRFTNFELRTLKKAKEEINDGSSINVRYEKIKEGKSIKKITFFFTENKNKNIIIPDTIKIKELTEEQIKQLIILSESVVEKVESNITVEEYVLAQMNYTANQKVDNIFGYMMKAIKEDFAQAFKNKEDDYYRSITDMRDSVKSKKVRVNKKGTGKKDFIEREYDYKDLEMKLLGWEKYEK